VMRLRRAPLDLPGGGRVTAQPGDPAVARAGERTGQQRQPCRAGRSGKRSRPSAGGRVLRCAGSVTSSRAASPEQRLIDERRSRQRAVLAAWCSRIACCSCSISRLGETQPLVWEVGERD